MLLIFLPFGLRRNPVCRDSSNILNHNFTDVIMLIKNLYLVEGVGFYLVKGVGFYLVKGFIHYSGIIVSGVYRRLSEVEERLGLFQPLTDDVAILCRNLEADVVPIERTGYLCRCAAPHEGVEHDVAFIAP